MALILFFHLLAVLTLVAGKPILIPRLAQAGASLDDAAATTLFDVTIESLGNTTVKAQVTNVGTDSFRLVQRGGILDQMPTKKVIVKGGDTDPTFTGVRVEYILSHLTAEGFVTISPKQTVSSTFDVADLYALTPGQKYTAVADGALEYTTLTDETKFLNVDYTSNAITFTAPADVQNRLEDRSTLVCSDEYNAIVQEAITRAAQMATAAAADARAGDSPLFEKFFKSTAQSDRDEVAGRLEAIAAEATSTGKLTYYCEPQEMDHCAANVAAMMYPSLDRVVNCPGYYSSTRESNYCGYLDQAGITLHEYAHAESLYPPGTEDIVYGYEGVLSLSTERAKNNADSFAYYASAVYLQCAADDSTTIGTPLDIDLGSETETETETSTSNNDNTETPTVTVTTSSSEPVAPTYTTTLTTTLTKAATSTATETATVTATATETHTQSPTETTPPGTDSGGSGYGGWGAGGGVGWDDYGDEMDTDTDTNTDSTTTGTTWPDTESGTGSGTWPGFGWGWTTPGATAAESAPTGTPTPVTTSTGTSLFNLQDLLDWLASKYTAQSSQTAQTQ
ncbi:Deuterolysin metalloprotease family-domain-containing protein [Aspergillus pseudoustus]|uniref:Neutral protease 2 n=1 Tax=Aspergillus pseudoustus TaxID=1810923 RepID=A0ABR4KQF3_9EURO